MASGNAGVPQEGDILRFNRGAYYHYAIYVGKGKVIHLTGEVKQVAKSSSTSDKSDIGIIKEDYLKTVMDGCTVEIANYMDDQWSAYSPAEIVKRARSRLGEHAHYNVMASNCEHFATWCRYGKEKSEQVDQFNKFAEIATRVFVPAGVLVALAKLAVGISGSNVRN